MARKRQRSRGQGTLFRREGRGPWIARWFDCTGKRKEASARTTDRAAAERILAKYVGDAALRKAGVVDARTDRYTAADRRPLAEHVADWKASLSAQSVTQKQVALLLTRVEALLVAVKAERLGDLSASAIQNAIGELRDGGKSLQTCQHYLRAIKQFSRWLRRDGRAPDDVLAHLTGYNASTDHRYERRPLNADEVRLLIDTAEDGPPWRGMSGADRAMLYRAAVGTGYRAAELRSLLPVSFHLDADPPTVALQAAHSKRRRDDMQPIRPDLAELVRPWLADKPPGRPVFANMPEKTALMIRADLRRAKARWIRGTADRGERRERRRSDFLAVVDDAGRLVDFHALRTTYITLLVKGGASVKVAQELARHSDPKLTMNIYSKLGIHDLAGALECLPGAGSGAPERERMRATGTDDARAEATTSPRLYPQQLERESKRPRATPCDDGTPGGTLASKRKTPMIAESSEPVRHRASECHSDATVAQLAEQRFCKPQVDGSSPSGGFIACTPITSHGVANPRSFRECIIITE